MLRRLELTGFKTFASRTVFELESGITAIIGPNGSGKSNLAEAVRWVLGEQSLRALRSRRTEDVIFAGGPHRPPAGLAEVAVTLDNSTGRLALPFVEVSVSRRAYRSGENEYLINRERSRLRDVTELFSRAGLGANTHVVVGQGLVDAALGLRPEERRALFEEAAGIGHHHARLKEAKDRLDQTQANLVRAADLAAELTPRLPALARQAERARLSLLLRSQLDESLFEWYSLLWRKTRARQSELEDRLAEAQAECESASTRLRGIDERGASLSARRDVLRLELLDLRNRATRTEHDREAIERTLAGGRERARGLSARIEEAERDLAEQRSAFLVEKSALAEDSRQASQLDTRAISLGERLRVEDERIARALARRAVLGGELSVLDRALGGRSSRLAEIRGRFERRAGRRDELESRLLELRRGADEDVRLAAELSERRAGLEAALQKMSAEQAVASAERAAIEGSLDEIRGRLRSLGAEVAERAASTHQLEDRRELLEGWRESQAGYYSGVRAVLQAARRPTRAGRDSLAGIVGPVAELVQSPNHLDTAIEVALGGHLQDVVVETWGHAEAAVELLKRTGAGRATFLPLDTLRAAPVVPPKLGSGGVHGVASDLVTFDARFTVVVVHLLGHTLVVDDLPIARVCLRELRGAWQIVTLAGEIVRSSGAITGGSGSANSRGFLARERELRRLPDAIATGRQSLAELEVSRGKARVDERELENGLILARRREGALGTSCGAQETRLNSLLREEMAQEQIRRLRSAEEARAAADLGGLVAETEQLALAIETAERGVESAHQAVVEKQAELATLEESEREASSQSAELRASRASVEQARRDLGESRDRRSAAVERLVVLLKQREGRLADLQQQVDEQSDALAVDVSRLRGSEAALASLREEAMPRETELLALDAEAREIESARAAARIRYQVAEDRVASETLEAERERLSGADIVRQVELDLGPTEREGGELLVRLGETRVQLDREPSDVKGLPARIADLRRKLRGVGSVGPEAIEEYEVARTREEFLTGQVRDLESASERLRGAIAELEETMRRKFLSTFGEVEAAFGRNFNRLFGGGTGRLELTAPDDPESSGIDIVAQLPGKRAQALSQLSGGERALTAAALIFALLEANPTPFCVLDEVDAALDEANIGRFCELLRERARLTQFLVITHNRRTMEVAEALYGLSMEDRAVSRAFSVRLGDG